MNTLITWAKEALFTWHNTQSLWSKDLASAWWHWQYAVNLWKRLEQYEKGKELKDVFL